MFPYLIAGAIGYAVAKIFEDDKTPKYADGGDIDYSNFKTSVIALLNKNKILILQRGSTANWMPNKWSIVGGVIEEGEVPIEAMIRECEEEIGLKPSNVYYDHKIMTNDSGEIYYFLGTLESRDIKLDYENSAYKFISKDEINNYDFVPYVKEFILEIFSRNEKKSNFKRGGDILLAPNGKPSNLTPEQYKLVRTPEFKAWFGDWENDPENASKVVDENGEPIVCFHYSPKEFSIFDKKFHPKIADFVENKYHKHLGYDFSTKKGFYKRDNSVEYIVFLNVRRMFDIKNTSEIELEPLIKIMSKIPYYERNQWALKHDIKYLKEGEWDRLELPSIEKYLFKKYDGLIMYERDWKNIKVYSEKNIKLADGTNTTFDGNNPDIRFKKGGSVGVNNDITYEIIDDEFGFLVLIKNNNEKIGEIFFEKDRDNSFTITDAVIDTKFKGNRIYPNAIIEILNRKPNITINSVFRSSDAEKSWDYLLKNLPKNIQQKKQHFKDENTTLYQISVNKNTKYDDGGSILLAPNGKPSNLTFKQYKLVRTPAFKEWFGDWENSPETASKVVDSNGEPLVVYHGTQSNSNSKYAFTIFNSNQPIFTLKTPTRQAHYFTWEKSLAEFFASDSEYNIIKKNIFSVFLNVREPANEINYALPFDEIDEINNLINSKYCDGVYLHQFIGEGVLKADQIVVFNSNQIKLADGTNTTFDGNNTDIRFAGGGKVKKVKFDIDDDEDEDRTEISIKGIGKVILAVTYPEYEFLEDIGEDGLEELGVEEGDMIGKIEHLEIEDKYKGQGYAKLLMNKAIEVAKEKGLMPLYLNASPMGSKRYGLDLYDLTSFYESLGFEVFLEQGNNNLMILKDSNNTDDKYEDGGNTDEISQIKLEIMRLQSKAFKMFPQSPKQKQVIKQIDILRSKLESIGGKFSDGGLLDDIFVLNTYNVQTGDDSYSHEEYSGDDYDEALSIYNGITPNDFVRPNSNYNFKNLTKNSIKYKFVGELEEGYEISDFTDTNLDDDDYWEYVGDDYEDLLSDKVEAINEVTDDYISEIQDFINNEYVKDRFSSKYMSIDVYSDEEQENHLDHITIRTTDHSQNPANKKGSYNLSFVIADANDTKHRWRSRDEYYFDSSDDIEDIKSEIITIIEEKIQEVKEDYE